MKTCVRCKQTKLTELFEVDRRKKYGRGSRCKECISGPLRCVLCTVIMKYSRRSQLDRRVCEACDGHKEEWEETGYQSPAYI